MKQSLMLIRGAFRRGIKGGKRQVDRESVQHVPITSQPGPWLLDRAAKMIERTCNSSTRNTSAARVRSVMTVGGSPSTREWSSDMLYKVSWAVLLLDLPESHQTRTTPSNPAQTETTLFYLPATKSGETYSSLTQLEIVSNTLWACSAPGTIDERLCMKLSTWVRVLWSASDSASATCKASPSCIPLLLLIIPQPARSTTHSTYRLAYDCYPSHTLPGAGHPSRYRDLKNLHVWLRLICYPIPHDDVRAQLMDKQACYWRPNHPNCQEHRGYRHE